MIVHISLYMIFDLIYFSTYQIQLDSNSLIIYYLCKPYLEDVTLIENNEEVNVKDALESADTQELSKIVLLEGIGNLYYEKKNKDEMLRINSYLSWNTISFPLNILK